MPDLRKKKPIALVSDVVSALTLFYRSITPVCSPQHQASVAFSSCELNLGLLSTNVR